MRFIVRQGSDPIAGADRTMLAAMGMPAGGVIRVGKTAVLARPKDTTEPTALLLGPQAVANGDVAVGATVEVTRAILSTAEHVIVRADTLPVPARQLVKALHGRPISSGDTVTIDPRYTDGADPIDLLVDEVVPGPSGLIGPGTGFVTAAEAHDERSRVDETPAEAVQHDSAAADALLTGLENELDVLSGWLSLLTSPADLPATWGLPAVAGVILEAASGVGKRELVSRAAEHAGAQVREVDLDLVFKPDRLLDMLEKAAKETQAPGVIFVDRLEAVMGEEGLVAFKSQVGAIIRWFIDAVADKPGVACVLGVANTRHLDASLVASPLLPRTLRIPPPDLQRRTLLFETGLAHVPTTDIDFAGLAARSAGFSGSDILAAIVHASALVAQNGATVTQDLMMRAIGETSPSLGSVPMGEMPNYGFDKVAGLADVKQRLTEAVIWPMTQPERFAQMGIDPPRGILLYGPPGTGKTFVIRALAHESGAAFFPVKGAELLDKYVGESERGVREVFERARAAAPSIIFFDELDALAPVRGSSTTSVTDSVVAAMLTELDGIGTRGDVVVIGATNRQDLVDPALLRSGRFEVHIELGLPEQSGRRALLEITDVPFAAEVDLDELAAKTDGFSFADMTGLLREAALDVLRSGASTLEVGWPQLDAAIARFRVRMGGL
jgi:transitional endoplasmic reticulum ATPase